MIITSAKQNNPYLITTSLTLSTNEIFDRIVETDNPIEKLVQLQNEGHNPYCYNAQSENLLHFLCQSTGAQTAEVMKHLLTNISPILRSLYVNANDAFGCPPIAYAIQRGEINVVRLLIEFGADPMDNWGNGYTTLLYASFSGNKEIVRCLLGAGADPNQSGSGGLTPLHVAVHRLDDELVALLLERQGDPNALYEGLTPLDFAIERNAFTIAIRLLAVTSEETQRSALNYALSLGRHELAQLITTMRDHSLSARQKELLTILGYMKGECDSVELLYPKLAIDDHRLLAQHICIHEKLYKEGLHSLVRVLNEEHRELADLKLIKENELFKFLYLMSEHTHTFYSYWLNKITGHQISSFYHFNEGLKPLSTLMGAQNCMLEMKKKRFFAKECYQTQINAMTPQELRTKRSYYDWTAIAPRRLSHFDITACFDYLTGKIEAGAFLEKSCKGNLFIMGQYKRILVPLLDHLRGEILKEKGD